MNGGEICDNIVWFDRENNGGGVYISSGKFNMKGGMICHNESRGKANGEGGGVFVLGNDSVEFTVSGNVTITDNKNINGPDNVFLDHVEDIKHHIKAIKNITVKGRLEKESLIGITTRDNETRTFTSGLSGRGSDSNFFSDSEDCVIGLDDNKEAALFEKTHTTIPSALNLTYSGKSQTGVESGRGYTLSGVSSATDAGDYTATATLNDGYIWSDDTMEAKSIDWSISPKAVTVTADDKSKTEGEADPELTATVTGLVEGEAESLIFYSISRIPGETAGAYTITPAGEEAQGNYSVTYKTGTLTITDKPVYVDPEDSKEKGGTVSPNKSEEEEKKEEEKKEDQGKTDVPEKKPDKVPVTSDGETYAAPEDNFAPVTGSGKVKDQVLDFTNVAGSGINPEGLKMTAINGSKFTTKDKLKDKDSAKGEGGVKVKVNKKTMIATITCKKDGSVTLTMEDGKTYTITFRVQKPKAQKGAKSLGAGSGRTVRTIKDLFGTDIDAGKLEILKQKYSQATLSGNSLILDPNEKDSIKLLYRYLDKKYKMTVKVK